MVIDEKTLRELIIKVIEAIRKENCKDVVIPKKKLYVILTEEWNGQYWSFFEKLNKQHEYDAYAVIASKVNNDLHFNNLKKFQVCKGIINEKDVDFEELTEYTTVFPIVLRNIIAKTALCIDDTFETKWIFKCMEKGKRIIFLKSGLQKFSKKEPFSYRSKILDYYRTLLEFDIEISDEIMEVENHDLLEKYKNHSSISYVKNQNMGLNTNELRSTKKIITENEITIYAKDNQIILNDGDIITEMARDRAQSLNIAILRR